MLSCTIAGHSGQVASIALSPDSNYIVSTLEDNTIGTWNIHHEQSATQGTGFLSLLSLQQFFLLIIYTACLYLQNYPVATMKLNDNGWIQNSFNNLLLWVPPQYWDGLYCAGTCHIIGNMPTTKVELTNAVHHGFNWLK